MNVTDELKELYLHVDDGNISDKFEEKRSVEDMIYTVFKAESYCKISEDKTIREINMYLLHILGITVVQ